QAGVTASGALATVVVERVIDGVIFVGLFFVFISLLPESGHPAVGAVRVGAYGAGLFFVTLLAVLIGAYIKQEATVRLLSGIGRRIHAGLTEKAIGLLEAFLDGLKVLPDRRRLVGFLAITAVYWALQGVGVKLIAEACHIPDMTLMGAFALLTVLVVGIMVPAGPGFAGSFELAIKASFALLVLAPESRENIVVFTVVLHVSQVAVQLLFGLVFLLGGKVRLSRVVNEGMSSP
ncbi:MAG: lysylphosphatidylglycerol synthase domain-containing protein, partial [bacterium]